MEHRGCLPGEATSLSKTLVHLLPLLLLLSACASETTPYSPPPRSGEAPRAPIDPDPDGLDPASDPALEDFLHHAGFLMRQLVERAPTASEVELALAEGDEALWRLLDIDGEEVRRRYLALRGDAQRLLERSPALEAELQNLLRQGYPPCDRWELPRIAEQLQRVAADRAGIQKEERVVCQWLPYTAALLACTITGNAVLYFACASIALCNYCSGGIVSSLCGS